MSHLAPCPGCNRHIDIAEPACPFCATALPAAFRAQQSPVRLRGRLGRAALMAAGATLMGAAACSANDAIGVEKMDATTPSYDGSRVVASYGGPIVLGTGGTSGAGGNVGSGGAVSTGGSGGATDAGRDAATDATSARDASQDRTFIAIYGAPFAADEEPSS